MLAYLLVEPPSTRIHSNSFAPVLSATFSLLSCCIMQVSLLILFHFFHNFNKTPSLILGQWSCLHNSYSVADVTLVILIMRFQLISSLDDLLIQWMFYMIFYGNNYGLIHFIADNFTNTCFSKISFHSLYSFHCIGCSAIFRSSQ